MIKAVFFDFDGVIRDSRFAIKDAYRHALEQHMTGPIPTEAELEPYIHHHKHVHKRFASHVSPDEFLTTYDNRLLELWHTMKAYDGAAEVIRTIHDTGLRIALVTSARNSHGLLEDIGVIDCFETIVGGDDTTEHKPHPEPILVALGRMKLQPNEAVMVGDMNADMEAARAAGLEYAVGVLGGFGTAGLLKKAGATHIIATIGELVEVVERIKNES